MVRYDWMQDLHEWFDYYLKDIGPQPGQWIEVNQTMASGALKSVIHRPTSLNMCSNSAMNSRLTVASRSSQTPHPGPTWTTEPLTETRLWAHRVCVEVRTRRRSAGNSMPCSNRVMMCHVCTLAAIMDLRYHAGGDEIQTWLAPVETITAMMEFMPLDADVEAGHTLRLSLSSTGMDYLPASTSSVVTVLEGEGSTLQLDLVDLDDRPFVQPTRMLARTLPCSMIPYSSSIDGVASPMMLISIHLLVGVFDTAAVESGTNTLASSDWQGCLSEWRMERATNRQSSVFRLDNAQPGQRGGRFSNRVQPFPLRS